MKKIFALFIVGLLLQSCSEPPLSSTSDSPSFWEDRAYSLEELIIQFQNWIPEEKLVGKKLYMFNALWEDYETNEPDDISVGQKYLSWQNDSTHSTPALYLFYMLGTINRSEDTNFFTPSWSEKEEFVAVTGEVYNVPNYSEWMEGLSTNYSAKKCAYMLLEFTDEYLNHEAMLPEWKKHRSKWREKTQEVFDSLEY